MPLYWSQGIMFNQLKQNGPVSFPDFMLTKFEISSLNRLGRVLVTRSRAEYEKLDHQLFTNQN